MKVVIVGGVAGGATAAARLRRLDEQAEITLIERDEYISYANCGLPYYIGDVIRDKEKLQVQTVGGMAKRYHIDIRVKSEVTAIDEKGKTVTVRGADGKEYALAYDKLILSCGAKPIKPNIEGLNDAENVFTLRNIPDTYRIKDYVAENRARRAVVIGGGFIGVEMAENLKNIGVEVTLVEKMPQVLKTLDYEMAQLVHRELCARGIELILGDGIKAFTNNGKSVVLESGKKLETDMTVLAIGVAPENTLAAGAGFDLGARGHLVVDERFNVKRNGAAVTDVFAIGDMIQVINPLDRQPYAVPLAWGANRQGRLVADCIVGRKIKKSAIVGASVLKVFSLTAASVGATEAMLKAKNIAYTAIHAHRANHASYYPDSSNIALKLLFDRETGRIYGAQAVGQEGTEKRIDVISTAMRLNGTAFDLSDVELCYAPPYSSAKDPVNILGYIAENVAEGMYRMAYAEEMDKIAEQGGYILDVRTPFEFENGHLKGAVNLQLDTLRSNLDQLPTDKNTPIYVNCQVGLRAYLAIRILAANGYQNLFNVSGGYLTYRAYQYVPTVSHSVGKRDVNSNCDSGACGRDSQRESVKEIDVTGLQCPGPLMATYQAINAIAVGEKLRVTATDSGFACDIENWCATNGHTLQGIDSTGGKYVASIVKGGEKSCCSLGVGEQKNATMVVFSGALDKVLASMIIAQGAAAQGKDVTMFFTFWGLNALRKAKKVRVKKTAKEKMFGKMMPRGAEKLPLSNMNMGGMGQRMIKGIMREKHVDSLSVMIEKAKAAGVRMIACTMSMDLMGIKKEELIDGIEYAGVATYIAKNENVGTTLFI